MASQRRSFGAFTLVELLVAVAVISVMASILLPVLGRARATAHSVECCSNLRQWGMALLMYTNDYEGYIPRRGQGSRELTKIDRESDWFNCLPPYLGELPYGQLVAEGRQPMAGHKSIFICPSSEDPGCLHFFPYAMNRYLSPWARPEPHNITEIPAWTRVAFLAEGPGPYSSTEPWSKPFSVVARHGGKSNVLFLDGHVRSFSAEYLGCGVRDPMREDVRWKPGVDEYE